MLSIALNRVILSILLATAVFYGMAATVKTETLIVILNGIFFGTMAAIIVAFWRLLFNAILGVRPYDRVRQMSIGFALCWIAYGGSVFLSVYFRTVGLPPANVTVATAALRFIAIIAAILQVTAPDFGLGIFHGRDRKALWVSMVIGLAVAAFTIYAQQMEVLEVFMRASEYLGVDLAFLT